MKESFLEDVIAINYNDGVIPNSPPIFKPIPGDENFALPVDGWETKLAPGVEVLAIEYLSEDEKIEITDDMVLYGGCCRPFMKQVEMTPYIAHDINTAELVN